MSHDHHTTLVIRWHDCKILPTLIRVSRLRLSCHPYPYLFYLSTPSLLRHAQWGHTNERFRWRGMGQVKAQRSFRKFQHHRLVLKEVGRPVQSFRNVKELIQVIRDALQGTFSHYWIVYPRFCYWSHRRSHCIFGRWFKVCYFYTS